VADEAGVPLIRTTDINAAETVERLRDLDPDLCICPAGSQILDSRVLDVPTRGFVGFHSSELPRGRGGAPVNWSLIDGVDRIWLSLYEYTPAVDAGDILAQRAVPVEPRDDVDTVFQALTIQACELLETVKEPLERDTLDSRPQSLAEATYRPRRQPQDGLIDWERAPDAQYDWVRALTKPYPGAYTFFDGHTVIVWRGEPVDRPTGDATPGEVLAVVPGEGVVVRTGDGAFRVTRLQLDDHPSMWWDTFADRYGIDAGTVFGQDHAPGEWLYTGIRDAEGGTGYETNLDTGETGRILAVVKSPARTRTIRITATFGGETVHDAEATVEGNGRGADSVHARGSRDDAASSRVRRRWRANRRPTPPRVRDLIADRPEEFERLRGVDAAFRPPHAGVASDRLGRARVGMRP